MISWIKSLQYILVECPEMVTISSNLNTNVGEGSWNEWKKKLGRFDLKRYDQNGYAIYQFERSLLFHYSGAWIVSYYFLFYFDNMDY